MGHIVAMVTCYVTKMITTCSPMVRRYFDIMFVASSKVRIPGKRQAIIFCLSSNGVWGRERRGRGLSGFQINPCAVKTC